jgi:glycosyltransferase involved in cell wall biosynthesis
MNSFIAEQKISAIVPVGLRCADPEELYDGYKRGLESTGLDYQIIFVLDGPNPKFAAGLETLLDRGAPLTIVKLSRSFGEATALMAGFERADGGVIVTLPAYHQIDPDDIGKLTAGLASADLCYGRRWPRAESWLAGRRRLAFHGLVSAVTGLKVSDLGCGARAMRRNVLAEISLYGDQHRFIPILADRQGFRVKEINLRQSDKDRFEGVYRVREYTHRALDIFTVFFLVRFTKKPLRFFGMAGVSTFTIGLVITLILVGQRLFFGQPLADRPALLLSSLLVVLGLQLFAIGLLGELIIFTHAKSIKDYQVDRVVEFPEGQDGTKECDPRREAANVR